ncbi:uncharacterized protein ColSpa_08398 [Colletotrichum spaethianum]|uniref:Glutathione-dependent formaldehyde-activating enzyme n=1 Tax=Colletotrichum spaethianum TaxID=700344 RepID=A0AA37P9P1_9PEZI|nr:uncharacterized protein ColSpa_08398 [Colletotrichum spaethianum]GKT48217.1 hypothetical protein ColSpa_08398 [Colletotrichum spaethianum]
MALQWSAAGTPTLREYQITPAATRGFCTRCSSWLYYRSEGADWASLCIGTVDEEVLVGKKGEGNGFGRALVNGLGGHEWCENEIPGVTDDVPLLRRGERNQGNREDSVVVKAKL